MRNFIFIFAISCSSVAVNQPPGHIVASENHLLNGKKQLEKGHCKQAIKQFDKAIEKDPTNFQAYYWRGIAYGICGDCNSLLMNLETSRKYKPSDIWEDRINIAINLCSSKKQKKILV